MTQNSLGLKILTICLLRPIIICFVALFASSCSNSMTDLVSSYDSRFPVKSDGSEDEYKPGIGEVGFEASQMLSDEYFKSTEGVLQLRGPRNAAFYKWELFLQTIVNYDGEVVYEKTAVELPSNCFQSGSSETTEYFIVYIPISGLKPGSYVISLTATSKGGERYTDQAALIIYDVVHYNDDS